MRSTQVDPSLAWMVINDGVNDAVRTVLELWNYGTKDVLLIAFALS